MKTETQLLFIEEASERSFEVWQSGSIRTLYIQDKKAIQSQLDMAQKEKLLLQHTRAMMSFLLFQEKPKSLLLLGLGGGSIIHFLTHWFPDLKITAVDSNEKVVQAGKEYFALSALLTTPQVDVEVADAFLYLTKMKQEEVSVILVDLHEGDSLPIFLHSPVFMERCFQALLTGGVLVINVIVENAQGFTDILTSLRRSFKDVSFCMTFKNQKNILLFAFKSPGLLDLTQLQVKASQCQIKYDIEFEEFISSITRIDAR